MSQSSPVVMIDGVKLNSEHVERELLKVKKYCIPMNRIVLQEKELGHGGFGIVKRATLLPPDSRTGTSVNVVVKELKIDDFKVIPLRAAYVRISRQ
ncbi:hypothetical protein FRC04_002949 [Tulasnella sp. 424]|nr:hypothetical protein FRC04_002949 [Tulasnella sp. 424]KAG8966368.1 hypothetical protein FRC05_002690 [Tulasnella sp. 425]